MDQVYPQFSVNLGVIPNIFFAEVLCVMYAEGV